jgi:hypothetical protein
MLSHAERRENIENLMNLLQKMELETESSIKMETNLLIAYSLVQIEKHLADKESGAGAID